MTVADARGPNRRHRCGSGSPNVASCIYPRPMPAHSDTSPGTPNELERTASSYLRSARHQPVQWHPWGEVAFSLAQAQNKPVLLDIGAVWCHWCHVMDRESYEDPEIASVINEHFVAVKVDRDERPDVDARYQAAVSAISGQGGWPLTAFLTPDGRPYFGGTYFPRDDRYGRPGFGRVLLTMSQVWKDRREEALESAASVMAAIEHNESFSGRGGELSRALVDKIAASTLAQFDPRNGGFGSQPKFPHPAALDLLLQIAINRGNVQAREAFVATLEKMARGGVYDQLAGGFHRYSVDERWVVPHFEKMLYDNTELLRNYVHGFQSFVREDFRRTVQELATQTAKSADDLRLLLDAARRKLLAARAQRPTPFIDRTLYTGWNAMAVTAYLETARVLRMECAQDFALLTLKRLLAEAWDGAESMHHVIAYDTSSGAEAPLEGVPGTLDDYAFTVHACVDAWIASGEMTYYTAAIRLADAMIARFHD